MIQTEAGLHQTIEILADMYEALADLHRRVAPQNFANYLILAEGPIEEIRPIRRHGSPKFSRLQMSLTDLTLAQGPDVMPQK